MAGGGTGQFAAVPLNLIQRTGKAAYIVTGTWWLFFVFFGFFCFGFLPTHCDRSSKAAKEAAKYGKVVELKPDLASLPTADLQFEKDNSYVYYCANETVHGVEFQFVPETNGVPLVADMSSNILTKDIDISKV